jgi:hypothetical protein
MILLYPLHGELGRLASNDVLGWFEASFFLNKQDKNSYTPSVLVFVTKIYISDTPSIEIELC